MTTSTTTKMDRFIEEAARKLVAGFSNVDGEMIAKAYEAETRGDILPLPMWSTLFKIEDSCDSRRINEMAESMMPEDERSALGRLIDNGIDLDDLSKFYTCEECGEDAERFLTAEQAALADDAPEGEELTAQALYDLGDTSKIFCASCKGELTVDEDGLVDAVREAWQESGDEDYDLASAGWRTVQGLMVLEFNGDLYLGANSAGHSFYDAYWIPLYKAMGYSWHIPMFREQRLHDAVSDLCKAEESGDDAAILAAARVVVERQRARSAGGPLSDEERAEAEQA